MLLNFAFFTVSYILEGKGEGWIRGSTKPIGNIFKVLDVKDWANSCKLYPQTKLSQVFCPCFFIPYVCNKHKDTKLGKFMHSNYQLNLTLLTITDISKALLIDLCVAPKCLRGDFKT